MIFILSPGSCPRGGTLGHWGCQGGQILFFKHGHVAYQINGDEEQNRMQVTFYPRVKPGLEGAGGGSKTLAWGFAMAPH